MIIELLRFLKRCSRNTLGKFVKKRTILTCLRTYGLTDLNNRSVSLLKQSVKLRTRKTTLIRRILNKIFD